MRLAKICILGEVAVGKTSLVRRFVDRTFSETYLTTVGVTISRKALSLAVVPGEEASEVQLVFWDLEGGQKFEAVSSSYQRGAHGAIVVGDLSRPVTMDAIARLIAQFKQINPVSPVAVALNKADLLLDLPETQPAPWTQSGEEVPAWRTSAKTGQGVDELIQSLGVQILRQMKNAPSR
jgi:small GTP-binding protein